MSPQHAPIASPSSHALIVTPSSGLGGGIERYVTTMVHALVEHDVDVVVRSLTTPGRPATLTRKMVFALRIWIFCLTAAKDFHLVLVHPDLMPVALAARWAPRCQSTSVICHGIDIWQGWSASARLLLRLLRPSVFGVSGFSAGALLRWTPAGVLPPGLDRSWFDTLQDAAARVVGRADADEFHVLSTFRLSDWERKGLPQLVSALQSLQGLTKITLHIAGHGEPSLDMRQLIDPHDWITIHQNLADRDLARLYAEADVFVLASRLRNRPPVSGEGFGLVLAEAQVAGTPVIAPARGGSWDAFWPGITGLAPRGETAAELADVLRLLIEDPPTLSKMREASRTWPAEKFDPDRHAALTYRTLIPADPTS